MSLPTRRLGVPPSETIPGNKRYDSDDYIPASEIAQDFINHGYVRVKKGETKADVLNRITPTELNSCLKAEVIQRLKSREDEDRKLRLRHEQFLGEAAYGPDPEEPASIARPAFERGSMNGDPTTGADRGEVTTELEIASLQVFAEVRESTALDIKLDPFLSLMARLSNKHHPGLEAFGIPWLTARERRATRWLGCETVRDLLDRGRLETRLWDIRDEWERTKTVNGQREKFFSIGNTTIKNLQQFAKAVVRAFDKVRTAPPATDRPTRQTLLNFTGRQSFDLTIRADKRALESLRRASGRIDPDNFDPTKPHHVEALRTLKKFVDDLTSIEATPSIPPVRKKRKSSRIEKAKKATAKIKPSSQKAAK